MSSAQRSASMDNIVRQVEALTSNIKCLGLDVTPDAWTTRHGRILEVKIDGLAQRLTNQQQQIDMFWADRSRTFLQRLRYLVTGK